MLQMTKILTKMIMMKVALMRNQLQNDQNQIRTAVTLELRNCWITSVMLNFHQKTVTIGRLFSRSLMNRKKLDV